MNRLARKTSDVRVINIAAALVILLSVFSTQALAQSNVDQSDSLNQSDSLIIVVMDPLSDRLACDCVEGYAQRKYQDLGAWLQNRIDRKVTVLWGESISAAMEEHSDRKPDIVVGKHSVVLSEARKRKLKLEPFASLTGKDGSTSQTGLVVVRAEDPALSLEDIGDYRIFYGPADCDEKYAAPQALLREAGLKIHDQPETCGACSEAAVKLIELPEDEKAAAIVSSYAAPLLEGCGAVQKGQLRVLAESDPVPFVTAFFNADSLDAAQQKSLQKMFLNVRGESKLLTSLETKSGFVAFEQDGAEAAASDSPPAKAERPAARSAIDSESSKKN